MSDLLKQAICLTGDSPCIGCVFIEEINCEEVRPDDCVEGDQHFVFVEDGEM